MTRIRSMSTPQALAVRRAGLASSALAATVMVHGATTEGFALLPIAPALWGLMVCIAVVCGARKGAFRARGPLPTLGLLLCTQGALHLALSEAPWAFGIRPHHEVPVVTGAALVGHVAAAGVLSLILSWGETILAALVRAAGVVRRMLAPAPPRRRVPPMRLDVRVVAPDLPLRTSGTPTRGPPLTV